MSITLRKELPIESAANLVNILVDAAGYHRTRLVHLEEPEAGHYHPDTPAYEQLTAGYFALAVETQSMLNKLCALEDRPLPLTFLSRVPDDIRTSIVKIAERREIPIDKSVLATVPFVPNIKRE